MEPAAPAAATRTRLLPYHSSTHRSRAPPHPARPLRPPPVLVPTRQACYLRTVAAGTAERRSGSSSNKNNSSRASTFLARCFPGRDASNNSTSSTANGGAPPPPPPSVEEDLHNLGSVEPKAPTLTSQPAAGAEVIRELAPASSEGLVFGLGAAGAWDAREVGSPVVKRYVGDDKERWFMWYHGSGHGDGGDVVGLAVSANGIHWERGAGQVESVDGAGLVASPSNDWWAFDTMSLRPAEVLIMSSTKVRTPSAMYWLYYTGFSSEKVDIPEHMAAAASAGGASSLRSLPGLAISQDGRHWARIEGEHHSGALLDVGGAGQWDSLFLAAPSVVYHGRGDLRMYYHSFDPVSGQFGIGIARSRDGIRWVKLGKALGAGPAGSFDEAGVLNAHVVRRGSATGKDGGYLMVFEGVSADGRSSIGQAESPDGLKDWRRCSGGEAILRPSGEGGWDDGGVGSPRLVQMDGEEGWRLYYRGVGKEGRTGIGLSVAEGGNVAGGFRRWTGFCSLE